MKRCALGRRLRSLDSFEATCYRLCAYHFSGFDYFRFPEIYAAVQSCDVQAFLGHAVTEDRMSLAVLYPKEET